MKDSIWITCYVLLAVAVIFEIVKWVRSANFDEVWWSFWINLFATIGGTVLQVWYFVQCVNGDPDDELTNVFFQFIIAAACVVSEIITMVYFCEGDIFLEPNIYDSETNSELENLSKNARKLNKLLDGVKNGYILSNDKNCNLSLDYIQDDIDILKNNTAEIMSNVKSVKRSYKKEIFRHRKSRIFAVLGVVVPLAAVTCAVVFAVVL